MRPVGPRLAGALAAACLWLGCGHDYYRAYTAANPGWSPDYPRDAITVDELLASIYAPPTGRHTTVLVARHRVAAIDTDPWEKVKPRALRDGSFAPEPGRPYLVAADLQCSYLARQYVTDRTGFEHYEPSSVVWYVVKDERLLAYEHTVFEERCRRFTKRRGSLGSIEDFDLRLRKTLFEAGLEQSVPQ